MVISCLACCAVGPEDAFVQALDSVSVTSSCGIFRSRLSLFLSDCRFLVDFWLTNPMSLLLAPSGCVPPLVGYSCMYVCIRVGFVYASDMKYSCRQGKAG
jgi:hypothetical protein